MLVGWAEVGLTGLLSYLAAGYEDPAADVWNMSSPGLRWIWEAYWVLGMVYRGRTRYVGEAKEVRGCRGYSEGSNILRSEV